MVSPGPNPLPAEVGIKRSAAFGDNFYYVDQKQWEIKPFALKTYADPIQEMVRKMIGRCFIFSFALFKYQEDRDVKNFVPKLPLPHDACIHKLLEIVKAEQGRCIVEVDSDDALDDADKKNLGDKFRITCEQISNGFIAKQLLGTLSTLQVGKNWNSHGAALGSCLCQLGALLLALDMASTRVYIQHDFSFLISQGNIQTGHKHGHHDVVYVEYMTAAIEPLVVTGGKQTYLNHGNFIRFKHAAKVTAIMDKKLPTCDAPAPRPTWLHTFDFNLMYCGARLIDGECKGSAADDEKAVLVLHSLEQLALKESALAMLTTNNCFTFYRSKLVHGSKTVQTKYDESNKFDLEPITDIGTDTGSDLEELEKPPTFDAGTDAMCRVVIEEDKDVLEYWGNLRSEIRKFIAALLYSLDLLSLEIIDMDIEAVRAEQEQAYQEGWVKLSFSATANADLKTKRAIPNQEDFIYCKRTMDPVAAQQDAIIAAGLSDDFRSAIQNNPNMSQEL